jgi:hypothetical protein
MKKTVFSAVFALLGILVFGQNLKEYTLVSPYRDISGSVLDVKQPRITKYALVVEFPVLSQAFQMTAAQIDELESIRQRQDIPLLLLTRTGNTKNFKLTVDRIIPVENVLGATILSLPKSFWGQNVFEVISLYLKTGRTDPDGRVARTLGR